MKLSTKATIRYRLLNPLKSLIKGPAGRITKPDAKHILLASDLQQYTSEQQFAPIFRQANALSEAGILTTHLYVHDVVRLPEVVLRSFNAVIIKFSFLTEKESVLRITRSIKSKLSPDARLIYFDGDDDVCVLWPELIDEVDLYVKKHVFSSYDDYGFSRIGKSNLTDYAARHCGASFTDDPIPDSPPVPETARHKIALGWNIAMDDKIVELAKHTDELSSLSQRSIDVCSRAYCSQDNWIYPFRNPIIERLDALSPEANVLSPADRVPQDIYYQEMLDSKICVSPFGYGELCWRDFEAVLCGCVLVKPNMDHIRTKPDVFVPNETYQPVRWDYKDLEEVIRMLLANPERMESLRQAAFAALKSYYESAQATNDFINLLCELGVLTSSSAKTSEN